MNALICFSSTDLTYKEPTGFTRKLLKSVGNDLVLELSSIGYIDLGNAIITNGYSSKYSKLIFIPYFDENNRKSKLTNILMHKALRNAFNLASLYKVRTLTFPQSLPQEIKFNNEEFTEVLSTISKDFSNIVIIKENGVL